MPTFENVRDLEIYLNDKCQKALLNSGEKLEEYLKDEIYDE
jgi:hypothetical protein